MFLILKTNWNLLLDLSTDETEALSLKNLAQRFIFTNPNLKSALSQYSIVLRNKKKKQHKSDRIHPI